MSDEEKKVKKEKEETTSEDEETNSEDPENTIEDSLDRKVDSEEDTPTEEEKEEALEEEKEEALEEEEADEEKDDEEESDEEKDDEEEADEEKDDEEEADEEKDDEEESDEEKDDEEESDEEKDDEEEADEEKDDEEESDEEKDDEEESDEEKDEEEESDEEKDDEEESDEEKDDEEESDEEKDEEEEVKEENEEEESDEENEDDPKEAVNSLLSDAKKTMDDVTEEVKEDSNLPITRTQAIELLMGFPQETSDKNHYLETEAIMKSLARYFEEDEEYWGMLGLLHDVDWHETKEDIENHTVKAEGILKDQGFDEDFISLVQSHAYGYDDIPAHTDKERRKRVEFALVSAETLTGLIYAYALMRGGRVSDMKVKGLKKKFNDRAFAAGCSRDLILEIENVGLDLDIYFAMAIDAVSDIRGELGLE